MRILYYPLVTDTKISTCSSVNSVLACLRLLKFQYPKAQIHTVLPRTAHGTEYLEELGVHIIRTENYRIRQQLEFSYVDNVVCDYVEKKQDVFFDIVITEKLSALPFLRSIFSGLTTTGTPGMVFTSVIQFILNEKYHPYLNFGECARQSEGLYEADRIYYSCHSQLDRGVEEANKYLSPYCVRRIIEKSKQSLGLFDFTAVPEAKPKRKDKIILNYAVGVAKAYRTDEILTMLNSLYTAGRNVEVQANTPGDIGPWEERHGLDKKFKHITWTRSLPYEEWLEYLQQGHIFVYDCEKGDVHGTVITQQLLNQVGIFKKDRYWLEDTVFEGYPYLYKDMKEARALVLYLVKNYFSDEVQEVIRKQKEFIYQVYRDNTKPSLIVDDLTDLLVDKKLVTKTTTLIDVINPIVKDIDEISWEDFCDLMQNKTEKGLIVSKPSGIFYRLPAYFRDVMLHCGFEDVGEEKSYFKRVCKKEESEDMIKNKHLL